MSLEGEVVNETVELEEKQEEFSAEELHILNEALGYLPLILSNPAYPKVLEIQKKLKRMFDSKK